MFHGEKSNIAEMNRKTEVLSRQTVSIFFKRRKKQMKILELKTQCLK